MNSDDVKSKLSVIDLVKNIFNAERVTQAEVDTDVQAFYKYKFRRRWPGQRERPFQRRMKPAKKPDTHKGEDQLSFTTNQVRFLTQLAIKRRKIDGENHLAQVRAEAVYAVQTGQKVDREAAKTIFDGNVTFDLHGVKHE